MQKSGTGPDFCENTSLFRSGAILPAAKSVGLEGTTVVHFAFGKALQRFSPLKRQVQGIKSLLFHFASCGRTCKVPQAPTSFPPENLRTVNFRLSPTPVHARRWRDEIESSARGAIFEKKRQSVRAYCLVVLPPGRTKRCRWHPGAGPDFCENRLKACAWAVFCK